MRIGSYCLTALLVGCADATPSKGGVQDTAGLGATDPDGDGDGYPESGDCNDTDATVHPGATEQCNGLDDDCDGVVDNGVLLTFWTDSDGDGHGDAGSPVDACAEPQGAVDSADDCEDGDADVHPGAAERCNGIDDDCNAVVDDGVLTVWYADVDEDGHGDADAPVEDCDPPDGFVAGSDDCDDGDPTSFPGATEVCDEADNNCDGTVDEGVTTTYYADQDGDGWGVLDTTREACSVPEGYAESPGDCDDDEDAVHPAATEICNTVDDDCDGDIDDDDAGVDLSTGGVWYADTDGDGYGALAGLVQACVQPADTVVDHTDCDDGVMAVNPGATEVCNGVDDDCDLLTDDADSGVDLTTATVYYDDDDGDGYGDVGDATLQCDAPSGTVTDATDCDDDAPAVHPGATEICDGIDDDCDGDIDDADAGVDLSTGSVWYADTDGDGYGAAATSTAACDAPVDTVLDATDCDDGDTAVHPGATEVCNGIDDDCDADIDDDDSSVDLSTGTTWYADGDADGLGDPDVSVLACDAPTAHVGNDDDCDDTDATDTDGDGDQDCADDDIDGDGLRNGWDADAYDDSVIRGPTGGLGGDGALSVTSAVSASDWTLLASGATSGATTLGVDDGSIVVAGDEVLVLSQQGTDAGQHQTVYVGAVSGNTLTIEPPLDAAYSAASVVLVQRIPHYTTLTVGSGASMAADVWGGAGGGVVIARATGAISIVGSVSASAVGFEGGNGVYGNSGSCTQGESHGGVGASATTTTNGGGGGCYPNRGDNGDSGAGGGYGGAGTNGTSYSGGAVTSGGAVYGDAALGGWHLGSGGGGGSPDAEGDGTSTGNYAGDGGAGGGLIALFSATSITVSGTVSTDGDDGDHGVSVGGEVGGGGGGSGGTIMLAAPSLSLTGSVSATGGTGGRSAWHGGSPYGSAYGGNGGAGRVRLEYTSLSGSTSPTAGSTGAYTD